ncbi:hypothetical protein BO996_09100 [Delftia sp. HK171]|uniref:hypothetical protein n=1 Tax=Delftia sp. HK171 TaxID=1920191 RepID=UPI0009032EC2|nr:hypothetical protein [Delftia sp. HK171]APE47999.1 hypothetical protein BO996_09100 [Delftia sp. HK171]
MDKALPRLLAAAALAVAVPPVQAVFTIVTDNDPLNYSLTLRVGTAGATVDTVAFSVTGANVGLTPAPVTGTPSIGISVAPTRPMLGTAISRPVTLVVDSSTALACQSGGCGSATIPFSKISWAATGNDTAASGDIQSGRFTASASQTIASYNANASFCTGILCPALGWTFQSRQLTGTVLQFTYDNDVVYPGGNYKGTVRFTASMV